MTPLFLFKIYPMKSRFILFIPAVLCFAVTFYLLTIPGNHLPRIEWMGKYQVDKLVHISMFFTLCFLFSYPIKNLVEKYKWLLYITIAGILYGIAMEFVQKYCIPFRSFEINDMIADSIGCAVNFWWWRRKFSQLKAV